MLVKRHIPKLVARLEAVAVSGPEYNREDWEEMEWARDDWTMKEQIDVFEDSIAYYSR